VYLMKVIVSVPDEGYSECTMYKTLVTRKKTAVCDKRIVCNINVDIAFSAHDAFLE
jgi:hypothetical protein